MSATPWYRRDLQPGHVAVGAAVAWLLVLILGGGVMAVLESKPGDPVSLPRAVFHAADVVTLTGFEGIQGFDVVTLLASLAMIVFGLSCFLRLGQLAPSSTRIGAASLATLLFVALGWFATGDFGNAASSLANSGIESTVDASTLWTWLVPLQCIGILLPVWVAALTGHPKPQRQLFWCFAAMAGAFLVSLPLAAVYGEPAVATDWRSAGMVEVVEPSRSAAWCFAFIALLGTVGPIGGGALSVLIAGRLRFLWIWVGVMSALFVIGVAALLAVRPEMAMEDVVLLAAGCVATTATLSDAGATGADAYVMSGLMLASRVSAGVLFWFACAVPMEPASVGRGQANVEGRTADL